MSGGCYFFEYTLSVFVYPDMTSITPFLQASKSAAMDDSKLPILVLVLANE